MSNKAAPVPEEPAYFTSDQYAARLQLSTKEIYREIHRGNLIAHKFRRWWRISVADGLNYERRRRMS